MRAHPTSAGATRSSQTSAGGGATGMFKLQDYLAGLGVTGLDGWGLDTALAISGDGRHRRLGDTGPTDTCRAGG